MQRLTERLDEREEKRQEGTLRKTPARPLARKEKKKTKKTLSQVLRISAPNLEASSSSCRSRPSRPDHTIPESEEEPEATSSSLQLVVFHPSLVPEPSSPNRPESLPAMMGTPMRRGLEAPNGEEAPVERSDYTAAVPPSWEELMDMLKGLPLFHVTLSAALLLLCPGYIRHPLHDAHTRAAFRAAEGGEGGYPGEADTLKKEKEALEGQVNEAGQENLQLKRDERTVLPSPPGEGVEDLPGMAAQKEEMEASFAAQKKELEEEYQQRTTCTSLVTSLYEEERNYA
ncbi:hypothetical protein AAG906_030628 [Vitis piasezkii]